MRVTMIGDGGLTGPLTALAVRAGHAVSSIDDFVKNTTSNGLSDILIVTGDPATVSSLMSRVSSSVGVDTVVVDATTRLTIDQYEDPDAVASDSAWMAELPNARLVRAFASVPTAAFVLLTEQSEPGEATELAIPMAGDDAAAKGVVAEFMRQIGLEPFDLGPLTVSYIMEPGGPLWGLAVDEIDMRECVGWLSGDG